MAQSQVTFGSVEAFAQFCAELTKQSVVFIAEERGSRFVVTITGF